MAIAWIKYSYGQQKANKYFYEKKKAGEKGNKYTQRFCKICGKPVKTGGLCKGCSRSIMKNQTEERTGNK